MYKLIEWLRLSSFFSHLSATSLPVDHRIRAIALEQEKLRMRVRKLYQGIIVFLLVSNFLSPIFWSISWFLAIGLHVLSFVAGGLVFLIVKYENHHKKKMELETDSLVALLRDGETCDESNDSGIQFESASA